MKETGEMREAGLVEVHWERIWLFLTVEVKDKDKDKKLAASRGVAGASDSYSMNNIDFFLRKLDENIKYRLRPVSREEIPGGSRFRLKFNITNPGTCSCPEDGVYYLTAEGIGPVTCQGLDLSADSRDFLYGRGAYSYQAKLAVGDQRALLIRLGSHETPGYKVPETGAAGKLKLVYQKLMRKSLTDLYRGERRRHVKKMARAVRTGGGKMPRPHVLFFSEQNERLDRNLLALRDRMKERGLDQEFDLKESCRITVTNRHLGMKSWIRTVKALAGADLIFMDDHAPLLDWLHLDPKTIVTQLWHAGVGFKASGYSRWGHPMATPPFSCHRQYTWGVTGAKSDREIFSELWGINDSMLLPAGLPRLDRFQDPAYREEKREELLQEFPICQGKKVVLFAPTYRGKNRKSAAYPFEMIDFEELAAACGKTYVILFRMHPWVSEKLQIPDKYREIFADAGTYPDIADLYCLTDLLITDYSSDIYEFSLMERPMLFYAFDQEEYSRERGFHLDYESSAPGKVVRSREELAEAIRQGDFEEDKVRIYRDKHFDHVDSGAADRIIDWILLGRMPEEILKERAAEDETYRRI